MWDSFEEKVVNSYFPGEEDRGISEIEGDGKSIGIFEWLDTMMDKIYELLGW